MSEESDAAAESPGYELVMPFVCCDDHGGPFNADAFVAGYQYSAIDHALRTIRTVNVPKYECNVDPRLIPQIELLAMHLGWKLTTEPDSDFPEDWHWATFEAIVDDF